MADSDTRSTLSGLSRDEAQEFHKAFVSGFIYFTLIAIVAHILVAVLWRWPWFPNEDGTYSSLVDGVTVAGNYVTQFLT